MKQAKFTVDLKGNRLLIERPNGTELEFPLDYIGVDQVNPDKVSEISFIFKGVDVDLCEDAFVSVLVCGDKKEWSEQKDKKKKLSSTEMFDVLMPILLASFLLSESKDQ